MPDQSPTPLVQPEVPEPSLAEKVSAYAAHLEEHDQWRQRVAHPGRSELARELAVILFRAEELHRSKVAASKP